MSATIYTLADLRTMVIREPELIVAGLLNEGETILLVGRPKVGKSRLTQQLMLDLVRAKPFLGHYPIAKARRVLVIDLENRPAGVKRRLGAMATVPDPSDANIAIYAPETLSQDAVNSTPSGIAELNSLIARCNPEVLIIDTWRLFVGGNENDATVVVQALKSLSEVRRLRPELAIILVHHLRKERADNTSKLRGDAHSWVESVSGHHALVGHVDACYGLERELDALGDELIVFGGIARNTVPATLLLEEDSNTLLFTVRSGEDALHSALTLTEQKIWDHAKHLGRFTFTALLMASKTTNKKAVSAALRKADSHGMLHRDGTDYAVGP